MSKEQSEKKSISYRLGGLWTKISANTRRCKSCGALYGGKPKENCQFALHASYYERTKLRGIVANQKERYEAITHYGGKCACCGFSDLTKKLYGTSFLQIDHINGGGRQHLKDSKVRNFYSWLKKHEYPSGYRVLCRGCNNSMEAGKKKCILHE